MKKNFEDAVSEFNERIDFVRRGHRFNNYILRVLEAADAKDIAFVEGGFPGFTDPKHTDGGLYFIVGENSFDCFEELKNASFVIKIDSVFLEDIKDFTNRRPWTAKTEAIHNNLWWRSVFDVVALIDFEVPLRTMGHHKLMAVLWVYECPHPSKNPRFI